MKKNTYTLFSHSKVMMTLPLRIHVFLFLFLCLLCSNIYAQDAGNMITVSGLVSSDTGEPLTGVNVIIKGTFKGAVSDIDGKYHIVTKPDDILVFRFIGFVNKEVKVSGKTTIDVKLSPVVSDLDEVVVVGYGEVKRANLLGAVASMTTEEIADIPAVSLTNLLDGRMAGVLVNPAQPTGNPASQTRITIRVESTFGTSNSGEKDPSPMYIVDGFEVSQDEFDVLDPSEIESFSVLKDASAAVYGSKGANGVILVKTKRGKEGKLRVSYSGSYGIADATTQTEMLSSYDLATILNERYAGYNENFTEIGNVELEEMKNLDYNWLDMAWRKASVQRHTVNISGGNEKIRYFFGGAYNYTEGNFDAMGVGKYSYRLGLDTKVTDNLSASVTISVDSKDVKRPYLSGTGSNTMEDIFQYLLQSPKWTPPYIDGLPVYNNGGVNPFALFNTESFRQDVDKGTTLNAQLTYEFSKIKGLKATVTYSRRESNSYYKMYLVPYTLYYFSPKEDYSMLLSDNVAEEVSKSSNDKIVDSYGYSANYQLNASLNYDRKFGRHSISAFATYEQGESNGRGLTATTEDMEIPYLQIQSAFSGEENISSSLSESGNLAGVARLNYSYDDKYLFESTVRVESSVKFSPSERLGIFPAVALGWVASQEDFVKETFPFFSFLKFRYSVGQTGYPSLGDYEYSLEYSLSGSYLFGGDDAETGMDISSETDVVSSGVSWEKSLMNNFGIDAKFLDSRLSVTLDMYYNHQYDILEDISSTYPKTSGITAMPSINNGELKAWGYDMSIGYNDRISSDIRWNISAIYSFGTNRILKKATDYDANDFRYEIGQSTMGADREQGYTSCGIIRTQEQLDEINAEWKENWGHDYTIGGNAVSVGSLYLQDIGRAGNTQNGEPARVRESDGYVTTDDMFYVENVNDKFVWKNLLPNSINMGFAYKNISLNMLWTMAWGTTNQAVDKLARTIPSWNVSTDEDSGVSIATTLNSPAFWKDHWTADNPNAEYPAVYGDYNASINQVVSTFWMKDVYQVRLKSLDVSYNMPSELSQRYKLPGIRFYISATNLWSPVKTFHYKEDAIARYNTYPLMRQVNLGLNITF